MGLFDSIKHDFSSAAHDISSAVHTGVNDVKTLGSDVVSDTKSAGHDIANAVEHPASAIKSIGHAIGHAAKETGETLGDIGKDVIHAGEGFAKGDLAGLKFYGDLLTGHPAEAEKRLKEFGKDYLGALGDAGQALTTGIEAGADASPVGLFIDHTKTGQELGKIHAQVGGVLYDGLADVAKHTPGGEALEKAEGGAFGSEAAKIAKAVGAGISTPFQQALTSSNYGETVNGVLDLAGFAVPGLGEGEAGVDAGAIAGDVADTGAAAADTGATAADAGATLGKAGSDTGEATPALSRDFKPSAADNKTVVQRAYRNQTLEQPVGEEATFRVPSASVHDIGGTSPGLDPSTADDLKMFLANNDSTKTIHETDGDGAGTSALQSTSNIAAEAGPASVAERASAEGSADAAPSKVETDLRKFLHQWKDNAAAKASLSHMFETGQLFANKEGLNVQRYGEDVEHVETDLTNLDQFDAANMHALHTQLTDRGPTPGVRKSNLSDDELTFMHNFLKQSDNIHGTHFTNMNLISDGDLNLLSRRQLERQGIKFPMNNTSLVDREKLGNDGHAFLSMEVGSDPQKLTSRFANKPGAVRHRMNLDQPEFKNAPVLLNDPIVALPIESIKNHLGSIGGGKIDDFMPIDQATGKADTHLMDMLDENLRNLPQASADKEKLGDTAATNIFKKEHAAAAIAMKTILFTRQLPRELGDLKSRILGADGPDDVNKIVNGLFRPQVMVPGGLKLPNGTFETTEVEPYSGKNPVIEGQPPSPTGSDAGLKAKAQAELDADPDLDFINSLNLGEESDDESFA